MVERPSIKVKSDQLELVSDLDQAAVVSPVSSVGVKLLSLVINCVM